MSRLGCQMLHHATITWKNLNLTEKFDIQALMNLALQHKSSISIMVRWVFEFLTGVFKISDSFA